MARESCNFDKDEAEILKPSSSSPPPSTSPPPPPPPPLLSLRQKRKAPEIDLNEDFASSDCAHRPDDEGNLGCRLGLVTGAPLAGRRWGSPVSGAGAEASSAAATATPKPTGALLTTRPREGGDRQGEPFDQSC
uniref:Uncharacterized protein n=1 Tax=Ananas comosus var. bracteatus TaxID=296719 RepID=A0A6V7NMY6_ANACO|nr:unnamed protein product [Ananas comosus var. bracteatus]